MYSKSSVYFFNGITTVPNIIISEHSNTLEPVYLLGHTPYLVDLAFLIYWIQTTPNR